MVVRLLPYYESIHDPAPHTDDAAAYYDCLRRKKSNQKPVASYIGTAFVKKKKMNTFSKPRPVPPE